MEANVTALPEGFVIDSGAPPSGFKVDVQPQSNIQPQNTGLTPEPSFFERLRDHADERTIQAVDIYERYHKGEQGLASSAIQMIGKIGVGAFFDFAAESLITGGKQLVSALPDQIEDPLKRRIAEAGVAFLNTDAGKAGLDALNKGVKEYGEWAKENPVNAANLEAIVNVAMVAVPAKANPGKLGQAVTEGGTVVKRSAVKSSMRNKAKFIEELVTPRQTAATKLAQVSRTTEQGNLRLRTGKVTLTQAQKNSAHELRSLKLNPKRSFQYNYDVISKRVSKENADLVAKLKATGSKGVTDKGKLMKELDAVVARIEAEPAIVGNAKQAALKVVARMKRELGSDPKIHVSDILAARKNFDGKFISQGRKALLDPTTENAMTFAIREVRSTVNGFLHNSVKNEGVRTALKRQHRLLNAMDDIAVKAAHQGNSAIQRTFDKAVSLLTLRNQGNQLAAAMLGMGGLGAAAFAAPKILAGGVAGGIIYKGGKMMISPGTRKGIAKMLEVTGKSGSVSRQLKADRALLREILLTAGDATEEEVE